MKIEKRKFRIGELARQVGVERFVIRFWEKEFQVKTWRSHGSQRFYTEDNLKTFLLIKSLLYEQGFTISGAKKQLKVTGEKRSRMIPSQKIQQESSPQNLKEKDHDIESLTKQIMDLKKQLHKLKELLS